MTKKELLKSGIEYYCDGEGGCCRVDSDCSKCVHVGICSEYTDLLAIQKEAETVESANLHKLS